MNLPTHPKTLGPTKSLNVDSDNCHRNVTISCLLSQSYPVKNEPQQSEESFVTRHDLLFDNAAISVTDNRNLHALLQVSIFSMLYFQNSECYF